MYFLLAETEYRSKNREKALEVSAKGLQGNQIPAIPLGTGRLADRYRRPEGRQGHPCEAGRNCISTTAVWNIFAERSILRNKWGPASKALENCRPYFTNQPETTQAVEYWLGVCYGQLRNPDQQIMAFTRALAIDPDFEPIKVALAAAKCKEGKSRWP